MKYILQMNFINLAWFSITTASPESWSRANMSSENAPTDDSRSSSSCNAQRIPQHVQMLGQPRGKTIRSANRVPA